MALLSFEDFEVGFVREFGSYHVTRQEILDFALKYDPQSFHIDEKAAEASSFGGLIASGWHTCAMCMRMLCDNILTGSAGAGSPGIDEIRWLKPVRPGDTLRVRMEVYKTAPSQSRPDRGTVWQVLTGINQHDEPVVTIKAMTILLRRSAIPA